MVSIYRRPTSPAVLLRGSSWRSTWAASRAVTTRVDGGDPVVSPLAFAPAALDTPLVSVGLDAAVAHPTACVALIDDVVFDGGN
jgi:hypothetical protein